MNRNLLHKLLHKSQVAAGLIPNTSGSAGQLQRENAGCASSSLSSSAPSLHLLLLEVVEGGGAFTAGDLLHGDLDAHLVVHVTGLGAGVLASGLARAAAVIHDDDVGSAVGLVHGHVEGGGAGAHAREGGGEGGGGGDEGGEGDSAHCCWVVPM